MEKTGTKKSVMDKEWRSYKIKGSNSWVVITISGSIVSVISTPDSPIVAKSICRAHNDSIKEKKGVKVIMTNANRIKFKMMGKTEYTEGSVIGESNSFYIVETDLENFPCKKVSKKHCIIIS